MRPRPASGRALQLEGASGFAGGGHFSFRERGELIRQSGREQKMAHEVRQTHLVIWPHLRDQRNPRERSKLIPHSPQDRRDKLSNDGCPFFLLIQSYLAFISLITLSRCCLPPRSHFICQRFK